MFYLGKFKIKTKAENIYLSYASLTECQCDGNFGPLQLFQPIIKKALKIQLVCYFVIG